MELYLNDSAEKFEIVLDGDLTADAARNLDHAWTTATSILKGKELVVDVSGLTSAGAEGVDLLGRMKRAGARLTAKRSPKSSDLVRFLGVPLAAHPARHGWTRRLLSLCTMLGFRLGCRAAIHKSRELV